GSLCVVKSASGSFKSGSVRACSFCLISVCLETLSCGFPQLDHTIDSGLQEELHGRSRRSERLALVRFSEENASAQARFFDGHEESVKLECCQRSKIYGVSRNQVVMIATTSEASFDPLQSPTELARFYLASGGPVLVLDVPGKLVKRSALSINAEIVALTL